MSWSTVESDDLLCVMIVIYVMIYTIESHLCHDLHYRESFVS